MASERVSFGTTCINRENGIGELWGPQALPQCPPALGADRSPAADTSQGTGLGS